MEYGCTRLFPFFAYFFWSTFILCQVILQIAFMLFFWHQSNFVFFFKKNFINAIHFFGDEMYIPGGLPCCILMYLITMINSLFLENSATTSPITGSQYSQPRKPASVVELPSVSIQPQTYLSNVHYADVPSTPNGYELNKSFNPMGTSTPNAGTTTFGSDAPRKATRFPVSDDQSGNGSHERLVLFSIRQQFQFGFGYLKLKFYSILLFFLATNASVKIDSHELAMSQRVKLSLLRIPFDSLLSFTLRYFSLFYATRFCLSPI